MEKNEARWREEFPVTEELLYLNSCSLAPLPERGRRALEEYARTWSLEHADPRGAVQSLRVKGLICDARPGLIRLSPHYFNTEEEIDRALGLLAPLREKVPA